MTFFRQLKQTAIDEKVDIRPAIDKKTDNKQLFAEADGIDKTADS